MLLLLLLLPSLVLHTDDRAAATDDGAVNALPAVPLPELPVAALEADPDTPLRTLLRAALVVGRDAPLPWLLLLLPPMLLSTAALTLPLVLEGVDDDRGDIIIVRMGVGELWWRVDDGDCTV